MKQIIHKADTRGYFDYGWLQTRHTFSFGRYYDTNRMNFGALRVLNDDIVQPGKGFGTHPHDNMEIISIPLSGALEHKDSTGKMEIIRPGEIQTLSAGSGLTHSEYNYSNDQKVNFLQLWILPKEKNIKPRYNQKRFDRQMTKNNFHTLVAPNENAHSLWINQDAYISIARLDSQTKITYRNHIATNGVYLFLIEGSLAFEALSLEQRDGLGLHGSESYNFSATTDSVLLALEVPMH